MKIIKPYTEILDMPDGAEILRRIERAGRTCYKSEDKITDESAGKFVSGIIKSGHSSVIEHVSATILFVCDRGVSHEIVRHRIASYSQESTRYCTYGKDKFGKEITVIEPLFYEPGNVKRYIWEKACKQAEASYLRLLDEGSTAQEARSVLPNSLKTEIVVTMNMRGWRNFFELRTPRGVHPQMRELTVPLLEEFKKRIPVIFDDINP